MLKQIFYRIGSELFPPARYFVPTSTDTMLVSYPKSGNTWVRALISQLVTPGSSLARMERDIPDIYTSRRHTLRSAYRFASSGRLMKSHESFNPSYKRVIYVARDPRDVCVSYYHYLSSITGQIKHENMSFDRFCESFLQGEIDSYGSWGQHVGSWLAARAPEFLLVKYENLHLSTTRELHRICQFLALDAGPTEIETAVAECSIGNLRAKEEQEHLAWNQKRPSSRGFFFRQGSVGNGTALGAEMRERIYQKWGDQMQRLGYT